MEQDDGRGELAGLTPLGYRAFIINDKKGGIYMDTEFLKGWKTQATAILTALFVMFNVFYPDVLTMEQEAEIIAGLIGLFGLFISLKMERNKANGGDTDA